MRSLPNALRSWSLAALLLLAGPGIVRGVWAAEHDEPRLVMPGGRAVRPGEWVDLRWTPADAVSELEILLSLDGGRTWTMCVTPPLDPARCAIRWRVPSFDAASLLLRIRYNRGGREIEGAPAPAMRLAAHGGSVPLTLPPLPGSPVRDRGAAPGADAEGAEETDAAPPAMPARPAFLGERTAAPPRAMRHAPLALSVESFTPLRP